MIDLVYILKEGNFNPDLRYSLRSIQKYGKNYGKIWIIGFKPYWLQNVEYIKVQQTQSKYKNSLKNMIIACSCNEISDNFVLMNDDFIAHKPIDFETDLNLCLKTIDYKIEKYKNAPYSNWREGFQTIKKLLTDLKCEHYMDFEVHAPMIFNKKKFLDMLKYKEVQEIIKTPLVLHYRTLYGNLYYSNPKSIRDVKIGHKKDLTDDYLEIDKWISVYDGVIENRKFPVLNNLLQKLPKSNFERV